MKDATITVVPDDKRVTINGESYLVEMTFDANLSALRWSPEGGGKVPGFIYRKQGDSHGFDDFSVFAPYITAWQKAKVAEEKRRAEIAERIRKEREAHEKEHAEGLERASQEAEARARDADKS